MGCLPNLYAETAVKWYGSSKSELLALTLIGRRVLEIDLCAYFS